jgi:hypothetical protein
LLSRVAIDFVSTVFGLPLRQLVLACSFAPAYLPVPVLR